MFLFMRTENTSTLEGARTQTKETAIAYCVMKAALEKLDECRSACPGVGGDIDASNLRNMMKLGLDKSAGMQAMRTLRSLSNSLGIEAEAEVIALETVLKI